MSWDGRRRQTFDGGSYRSVHPHPHHTRSLRNRCYIRHNPETDTRRQPAGIEIPNEKVRYLEKYNPVLGSLSEVSLSRSTYSPFQDTPKGSRQVQKNGFTICGTDTSRSKICDESNEIKISTCTLCPRHLLPPPWSTESLRNLQEGHHPILGG